MELRWSYKVRKMDVGKMNIVVRIYVVSCQFGMYTILIAEDKEIKIFLKNTKAQNRGRENACSLYCLYEWTTRIVALVSSGIPWGSFPCCSLWPRVLPFTSQAQKLELYMYVLLWAELCLHIHMWKPSPLVPYNVTVFGDSTFRDVIKLKWSC